jgi:hypothetical protein
MMSKETKPILSEENHFEMEALQGWVSHDLEPSVMKNVRNKLFRKISALAIIASLALLSSIVLILNHNTNQTEIKKDKEQAPINKSETKNEVSPYVATISSDPIIRPKTLQSDFKKIALNKVQQETNSSNELSENEYPKQLTPLKATIINVIEKERINIGWETYLLNYKVLDYRKYRSKPKLENEFQLSGTPADQEKKQVIGKENDKAVQVNYFNSLNNALVYFEKENYGMAAQQFDMILTSFPDDINALFYGALSHYNVKEYSACETKLKLLKLNNFTNFSEEQEWYLCLTYKALKKMSQYEELRKEIINKNGFYTLKAVALK